MANLSLESDREAEAFFKVILGDSFHALNIMAFVIR
jgi:hypothetical protein